MRVRQIEIRENGINSVLERDRLVIGLTIEFRTGPGTFVYLGAWPEIGGGAEVVEEDSLPERLTEPPLGFVAGHGEFIAGDGVEEEVVNDAVVGRVEAGDDGVVVGESEGWEDGDEAGLGFCAVLD